MNTNNGHIAPDALAFDIDGVLADTMSLFITIAREKYGIRRLRYEDITSYMLEDCLDLAPDMIATIIGHILEGTFDDQLEPMPGAAKVLQKISRTGNPILFVTARHDPGTVPQWIQAALSLAPSDFTVVATGSFDKKIEILHQNEKTHFVEDRFETCVTLEAAGITPILYRQPWNRMNQNYLEVTSWQDLATLIAFDPRP